VFAVRYDDETCFYRKDAQANIVDLLDNTGATVVKYRYDAWGNCKRVMA
jgi:YD repeat-containing protein